MFFHSFFLKGVLVMRKFSWFFAAAAMILFFAESAQARGRFFGRRCGNCCNTNQRFFTNSYTGQGFFTNNSNYYGSEQIFGSPTYYYFTPNYCTPTYYPIIPNSIPNISTPNIPNAPTFNAPTGIRPGSVWIADENGILRPAPANFRPSENKINENRP